MKPHIEKEFKLLLTKDQFKTITTKLKDKLIIHDQTNIYFDTIDNQLSNKKIALRIRYLNNKKIITLKYYENNDLMEIETATNFDNPLDDTNIKTILTKFNITQNVVPILKIHTTRYIQNTEYAEICVDENTYNDKIIDFELEYEVKKQHDDFTTFLSLIQNLNLVYEKNAPSKLVRGLTYKTLMQ